MTSRVVGVDVNSADESDSSEALIVNPMQGTDSRTSWCWDCIRYICTLFFVVLPTLFLFAWYCGRNPE